MNLDHKYEKGMKKLKGEKNERTKDWFSTWVWRSQRVCSYWCNKGFKEAGIPIHMIAGSSMGALIGTFYAASSNVERLYKLASVLSGSII